MVSIKKKTEKIGFDFAGQAKWMRQNEIKCETHEQTENGKEHYGNMQKS